jgi:tubulin polyglutamylase TTLL4
LGRKLSWTKRRNIFYLPHSNYIASRYVARPHLINGFKYDLRLYVVVTSFDPLKIYLYQDGKKNHDLKGLVRFATEKYTTKQLGRKFIHLTNYSINRKAERYKPNNNEVGTLM